MFRRFANWIKWEKEDLIEVALLIPTFSLCSMINQHLVSLVETEGPSMKPTLNDSNLVLIDKFFYKHFREIKKGDIIVSTSPIDPEMQICKRVLYTPGETKEIKNDFWTEHLKIPQNHVWIEGDNKNNSFDSRNHGPLPIELIQGRVLLSLYPFKFLHNGNADE